MATLQEIETYWSTSDLLDAIYYLDFESDVEAHNNKIQEDAAKKAGKV